MSISLGLGMRVGPVSSMATQEEPAARDCKVLLQVGGAQRDLLATLRTLEVLDLEEHRSGGGLARGLWWVRLP